VIEITGAVDAPFSVPLPLTKLATLPRRELTADFHCVAGWSATDLSWEGVSFEAFYRTVLEPEVKAGASITHVSFGGLDGYQSVALIEDALADDVLIAERLNGLPLGGDHGAPARLVSPSQYGFVNTKHLCRIELHTAEPPADFGGPSLMARAALRTRLIWRHPRARVWNEERHPLLPAWLIRPVYRIFIPQIRYLSARGSGPTREPAHEEDRPGDS
jgi:DMSO/TMAO reductase YedYZ molybdopterin-dependent catalytic subunit